MARFSPRFSYNLTRDYEIWWFPWAIAIGGVIFTVLISTFSLVTNGYYLDLIYTTDPNATLAEPRWYDKPPFSWTGTTDAKCQATQLQAGATVFTQELWRQFQVDGIETADAHSYRIPTPVVMYMNNPLSNCSLFSLRISVASNNISMMSYRSSYLKGLPLEVKATIHCYLDTPRPVSIRFSTELINVGPKFSNIAESLDPELLSTPKSEAIQILARKIQSMSFMKLEFDIQANTSTSLVPAAYIVDTRSEDTLRRLNGTEPLSVTRRNFTRAADGTSWFGIGKIPDESSLTTFPPAFERIVKLFYASIFSELGQPTVFDNPDILYNWTDSAIEEVRAIHTEASTATVEKAEAWKQKARSLSADRPLSHSTIYTQYHCQIPKLKGAGTLIMAVFLADLVFLRALWWLFNWMTVWWLQRADPRTMACKGCAEQNLTTEAGEKRISSFSATTSSESLILRRATANRRLSI